MSLMGRIERRIDKNVRLKAAEMAGRELAAECVQLRLLVLEMWEFCFGPNSGENGLAEYLRFEDKILERMESLGFEVER